MGNSFARLNTTGDRTDDIMPWLLMVKAYYIVDFSFIMVFHCLHILIVFCVGRSKGSTVL